MEHDLALGKGLKHLGSLLVEGDEVGGGVLAAVVGSVCGGWAQLASVEEYAWWFFAWHS